LKKSLILSYFFPPGNFTVSYRIALWAKYLKEYDIYPIVVTRNWENNIVNQSDASKPTPWNIIHKK